ncbi:MAG: hypothetical protein CMJ78_03480 [Planctomycetaceae bacterium]|nr:hypothetical protein [Planctomycetaceae bacterium]
MSESDKIGGIVLCGGASRRMGQPKLMLPFGEQTMLQRVVAILQEVTAPIVVVAAKDQPLPDLPADVIIPHDEIQARGPLAGLAAGLKALKGHASVAFVSACDCPLLTPEFVRFVHSKLGTADLAIPHADGFHHPLAAVYRIELEETVRKLIAAGRMRPFFLVEESDSVEISEQELRQVDPELDSLRNANTPEEYQALLERREKNALEHPLAESFLAAFANGEVDKASGLLRRHPGLKGESTTETCYQAHSLLREFVHRNGGHCSQRPHMLIADLLIPERARAFRESIVNDRANEVRKLLQMDSDLIHAEFTAGCGIGQPIHHWSSTQVADVLLAAGAELETLTTRGESPLSMQLRFGSAETVRYLLEKGADPNNGNGGHMPSDSLAELIELQLQHGWKIPSEPMLHDANHGHGQRVMIWLKYGADPNAINVDGRTALHMFAAKGIGRDVIKALAQAGANIDTQDDNGQTPLDVAKQAARQTAAKTLEELGAD